MHPRTRDLLLELVTAADAMVKADRPLGMLEEQQRFDRLLIETTYISRLPAVDEVRMVDDATVMLSQCLRNAEREGPHGDAKKWIEIAKGFLPWVRADLALAIGASHLPDRE